MTRNPVPYPRQHASSALLFRVAFARARPCYCYGCICLTPDERAYERRVFRVARAWAKATRHERKEIERREREARKDAEAGRSDAPGRIR